MTRVRSYAEGDRVRVRDRLGRRVVGVGTIDRAWRAGASEGVPVQLDGRTKVKLFEPALVELVERDPSRGAGVGIASSRNRARMQRPASSGPSLLIPQPKPEGPVRDAAHLAFVREHPCCGCGAPAFDAHHWAVRRGERGVATKGSDLHTVPLCRACHDHVHQHGTLPALSRARTRWLFMEVTVALLEERLADTRRLIREMRGGEA